jgi:Spy/CpxP family protein refolding chaperone
MMQALNLTAEQQQKLEDLRYERRKESVTVRRDMELKRLDLEREMSKDNPDPAAVDRLLDEQGALRIRMNKTRVHQMLDMKKILTPEQWSKARELMQARRAQRLGGRGGRLGRGDGMGQGQGSGSGGGQGPGLGQSRGPGGHGGDDDGDDLLAPGF